MDPTNWKVDLGHSFGPLELGAERDVLLARLAAAEIDIEQDDEYPAWLLLSAFDIELTFDDHQPPRLLQIVVDDEWIRFGKLPVIGRRVHEIVELLHIPESETLWRVGVDPKLDLPGPDNDQPESATDEELLKGGTLWITTLGLGLELWRGEIIAVLLRQPQDSPQWGVGHFLPQHAELSRNPNPEPKLTPEQAAARRAANWSQSLLNLGLFLALGIIVVQTVLLQLRWNSRPSVEGRIVATKPPPPDPFPTEFTVAFKDEQGVEHQVQWGMADVTGSRAIGAPANLRYLPEDPQGARGFNASNSAAFESYLPWGIGVFVVYMVVQVLHIIAGFVLVKKAVTVT